MHDSEHFVGVMMGILKKLSSRHLIIRSSNHPGISLCFTFGHSFAFPAAILKSQNLYPYSAAAKISF